MKSITLEEFDNKPVDYYSQWIYACRDKIYNLSYTKRNEFEKKLELNVYNPGDKVILLYGGSSMNFTLGRVYTVQPWKGIPASMKIIENKSVQIMNDLGHTLTLNKHQVILASKFCKWVVLQTIKKEIKGN